MARGDIVSDTYVLISGSGTVDIQPASGDEWKMNLILMDAENVQVRGYDGSNLAELDWRPSGSDTAVDRDWVQVMSGKLTAFFLTNSQYMRQENVGGSAVEELYSAMKIKE
jgi:LPS O-antigen subunit length determinant protein (WzzB/FepE family)